MRSVGQMCRFNQLQAAYMWKRNNITPFVINAIKDRVEAPVLRAVRGTLWATPYRKLQKIDYERAIRP